MNECCKLWHPKAKCQGLGLCVMGEYTLEDVILLSYLTYGNNHPTSRKAEAGLIESLRIYMMMALQYLNKSLTQGTCACISNSSKQFILIYVDTFGGHICSDLWKLYHLQLLSL